MFKAEQRDHFLEVSAREVQLGLAQVTGDFYVGLLEGLEKSVFSPHSQEEAFSITDQYKVLRAKLPEKVRHLYDRGILKFFKLLEQNRERLDNNFASNAKLLLAETFRRSSPEKKSTEHYIEAIEKLNVDPILVQPLGGFPIVFLSQEDHQALMQACISDSGWKGRAIRLSPGTPKGIDFIVTTIEAGSEINVHEFHHLVLWYLQDSGFIIDPTSQFEKKTPLYKGADLFEHFRNELSAYMISERYLPRDLKTITIESFFPVIENLGTAFVEMGKDTRDLISLCSEVYVKLNNGRTITDLLLPVFRSGSFDELQKRVVKLAVDKHLSAQDLLVITHLARGYDASTTALFFDLLSPVFTPALVHEVFSILTNKTYEPSLKQKAVETFKLFFPLDISGMCIKVLEADVLKVEFTSFAGREAQQDTKEQREARFDAARNYFIETRSIAESSADKAINQAVRIFRILTGEAPKGSYQDDLLTLTSTGLWFSDTELFCYRFARLFNPSNVLENIPAQIKGIVKLTDSLLFSISIIRESHKYFETKDIAA